MGPRTEGFILGLAAAFICAFIFNQIRWLWGQITRMFRPQTVVHVANRTPWQIVSWALTLLILISAFLVIPACMREPARCQNIGALLVVLAGQMAGLVVAVARWVWQFITFLFQWLAAVLG